MNSRESMIVKTSIVGIVTNIILSSFKAMVGIITGSIAIVLDAVNNLSDALSSTITIIGTKLASKAPDRKHPLGHGRVEYISAALIAMIVLYAGLTSLIESVKKIIDPVTADYSAASLVIVAVAVVVKIFLGTYFIRQGGKYRSDSLTGSGKDALLDSVVSASTLVAAFIFILFGVSLEAYLGVLISLVIIKAGYDMLRDTVSKIIGVRVDPEFSKDIKKTISEHPDVSGAYDLVMHSYGPDRYLASVHIEVKDTLTAAQIDVITREIQDKVLEKHGVILTAVGIYSVNTSDDECAKIREDIYRLVLSHDHIIQVHGFYADMERKKISFDFICDFTAPDMKEMYEHILQDIRNRYKDFDVRITMDVNITD
ncbi:MAG: cation transporter [Clostridiales bacterium]|nr:cation transporter [Clostridiales bacterium]